MFSIVSISPHVSGVRADGTAVWLTSVPMRDNRGGPRIRVTIAGGCPKQIAGYYDISNPGSANLTKRFLPQHSPTNALRCLYLGKTLKDGTRTGPELTKVQSLDAGDAKRLQQTINGLPLGSPGAIVTYGCGPGWNLSAEIIVFGYPGGPDVDLWHSKGCLAGVDNGFITTSDFIRDF
jgi:hypothetical protein